MGWVKAHYIAILFKLSDIVYFEGIGNRKEEKNLSDQDDHPTQKSGKS